MNKQYKDMRVKRHILIMSMLLLFVSFCPQNSGKGQSKETTVPISPYNIIANRIRVKIEEKRISRDTTISGTLSILKHKVYNGNKASRKLLGKKEVIKPEVIYIGIPYEVTDTSSDFIPKMTVTLPIRVDTVYIEKKKNSLFQRIFNHKKKYKN